MVRSIRGEPSPHVPGPSDTGVGSAFPGMSSDQRTAAVSNAWRSVADGGSMKWNSIENPPLPSPAAARARKVCEAPEGIEAVTDCSP